MDNKIIVDDESTALDDELLEDFIKTKLAQSENASLIMEIIKMTKHFTSNEAYGLILRGALSVIFDHRAMRKA